MHGFDRRLGAKARLLLVVLTLGVAVGQLSALAAEETSGPTSLEEIDEALTLLARGKARKASRLFAKADRASRNPMAGALSHLAGAYAADRRKLGSFASPKIQVLTELQEAFETTQREQLSSADYNLVLQWTSSRLETAEGKALPLMRVLHCHLKTLSEELGHARVLDQPPIEVDSQAGAPERLFDPLPTYFNVPRSQGSVALRFTVDREGCTRGVEVREPEPADWGPDAVTVARWWVFVPVTKDGQPVAAYYDILLHKFHL